MAPTWSQWFARGSGKKIAFDAKVCSAACVFVCDAGAWRHAVAD
jgi:hypothetical protein